VKVVNVHERQLPGDGASVLDDLERVWPAERWPMLTEHGLGFLQHELVEHEPGRRLVYRITGPRGLSGRHGWELEGSTIRHTVEADSSGLMLLGWPLVVQPIHNALHEDVLDSVESACGGTPAAHPHSRRVRLLRGVLRRLH
jgi:hypothetical protein